MLPLAPQRHAFAEEECFQGAASPLERVPALPENRQAVRVGDHLNVRAFFHQFIQESSVIVVGMGQKQAADIRPLDSVPLHSFSHTFQFTGIARIDHDISLRDFIDPGIHDTVSSINDPHHSFVSSLICVLQSFSMNYAR